MSCPVIVRPLLITKYPRHTVVPQYSPPISIFIVCSLLILCSKDPETASPSKNNLKCKTKFKKIRSTSPTYLSLKMSWAVFLSFFLTTSFRGKSAFIFSRGPWHLSFTTLGISNISKRCSSIGGNGSLGWKALCCKHCKKQFHQRKTFSLCAFNIMSVCLTSYGKCKISSILKKQSSYCWEIFQLTSAPVQKCIESQLVSCLGS